MTYTKEEREAHLKTFLVRTTKSINLVPYKFKFVDYDEKESVITDQYTDSVESPSGEYLELKLMDVVHWPTLKDIFDSVNKYLKENPDVKLENLSIGTESHYIEGWDDGPFEEIRIAVSVPRSTQEIDKDIDWQLECKRAREDQKKMKEEKERKLLEELKEKYE